jgi:hypothetical protein
MNPDSRSGLCVCVCVCVQNWGSSITHDARGVNIPNTQRVDGIPLTEGEGDEYTWHNSPSTSLAQSSITQRVG